MASELTDEQMAALDRIIVGDDGVRPIMFPWMAKALSELRARRAREKALREALKAMTNARDWACDWLEAKTDQQTRRFHAAHLRLIGGTEAK